MPEQTADVAVVGMGPVGSVLAILLAQHGRSVTILERWPEPYPLPRAVHFDHEVGRILQGCGIGAELRAASEPAEVYEWRNAEGTTLLRFGRIGHSASGWPESSMFHQPTLEALLEARVVALGVDVRRGVEVVGLDQDDDGVTLRAADGGEVRARYVVGCDGANSTVRGLVGLPVHDHGFAFDWLIVDVVLDEARTFDPLNVQICDPERPTTAVSGGPGRRRWEFMRLPHEAREALADPETAWTLLAPWDVTPDNATLERHALYTFNARCAEAWRAGRVLVAGDAAHLMPPFAGQGMCSGVRDAANLAWKLDLVLGGLATDALLDTYEAERRPSAERAIDFSVGLGQVICVSDPAEAAARDEAMAAEVGDGLMEAPELPGIDGGLIGDGSAHAGRPLVQGDVDGVPSDEVHGVGWRLVTLDGEPTALDADLVGWFASLGGTVVPVPAADAVMRGWLADRDVRWALQRPDFHLYGTAADAAGATDLLRHLRHDLTRETT